MPYQSGNYTSTQIQEMGLNPNETVSAQQYNGVWYKLDNDGKGGRNLRVVQPVGQGMGSGGFSELGSAPSSPSTPIAGFNQPTIDLVGLYQKLYDSSGVKDLQDQLSQKERAYIEATGVTNDNPFLSEATRVGRVAKLDDLYQKRTANLKNDIATRKADIETQLNLQTKQFDINSSQAQLALDQFNTLLSMGALDNASGEDIANITRATGLTSSAIYSAIQARKNALAKENKVSTQVISYDDGTNQGYAVINSDTGEIINKQTIASSKPASTGGSSGTMGLSNSQYQKAATKAQKLLTAKGKDEWVDINEYRKAVNQLVADMGIEFNIADDIMTAQMKALGLKKYRW